MIDAQSHSRILGLMAAFIAGCAPLFGSGDQMRDGATDGSEASVSTLDPSAIRAALANESPASLPLPPTDVTNRLADDPRAAALGQRFFFDPGFSGPLIDSDNDGSLGTLGHAGETGKVACVGCHVPASGFVDSRSPRRQIPLGAQWGLRRAKPIMDVGQATLVMWDGRHDALWNQVFTPFESDAEINSGRLFVALEIYRRYRADYEMLFGSLAAMDDAARFPRLTAAQAGCHSIDQSATLECHGKPGDNAEFDHMTTMDQDLVTTVVVNVGKAIEAYERRLSCGPSRFDAWMHGDPDALTASEQHGASLFATTGCVQCHSGPHLTDQLFHNVGLEPVRILAFIDSNDHGAAVGLASVLTDPLNTHSRFSDGDDHRLPTSVPAFMEGAFRTPSLRCVASRPSFMHTGQYRTLEDVVTFFNRGGDTAGFPGTSENHSRAMSPGDMTDLVAFLRSLDGPGPEASLLTSP